MWTAIAQNAQTYAQQAAEYQNIPGTENSGNTGGSFWNVLTNLGTAAGNIYTDIARNTVVGNAEADAIRMEQLAQQQSENRIFAFGGVFIFVIVVAIVYLKSKN